MAASTASATPSPESPGTGRLAESPPDRRAADAGRACGTSCCSSCRWSSSSSSASACGRRTAATPPPSSSTTTPGCLQPTPEPFIDRLWMAAAGTIGCLLVGIPLAYFIATRGSAPQEPAHPAARHPVLDELPHPDLCLADHPRPGMGLGGLHRHAARASSGSTSWARRAAVLLGLVYGYLPLMVFPLYVTLERMDRTLIEASKDLGAGRWATFRQITLPIALPGLVTGSILVFIPMMGEYVIPADPGLRPDVPRWATRWSPTSSRRATGHSASARAVGLILDHAGHDHGLPVVREPRPADP